MEFSEFYGITRGKIDDWFDPVLTLDTRLFLDPFLLYASEQGQFIGSHAEVVAFFNSVFQLVAQSGGNHDSLRWQKALELLRFREVDELCLGYTVEGTKGTGSGRGFARIIAGALWEAVQAGLTQITHFEEVAILREGIGADRISDITACLLRTRLAAYTTDVCQRHGIPLRLARYTRAEYDVDAMQWIPKAYVLPDNPHSGAVVLLAPQRYLRSLPTISPEDFWEYCYDNENEVLRTRYSDDIARHVDKHTIVDLARNRPDLRHKYIAHVESADVSPYDFMADPEGLKRWYGATRDYVQANPITLRISSQDDFVTAVVAMIKEFRNFVENNRGWALLWNDNRTPRRENSAQHLFLGIVKHYCRANNIDVSREANIGRGPVDFKVSHGYALRALLELKLARNSRFWNGLERQLPKYQEAESVRVGYFLVLVQRDLDYKKLKHIEARIGALNSQTGYEISHVVVDARYGPTPASKL